MTATWAVPSRIETERLVLRRYTHDDATALSEVTARNKAHLERYMAWAASEPLGPEERLAFIDAVNADFEAGTDFTLGIFEREGGAYCGGTGYHVRTDPDRLEIGYWIDAERQGQGLITEAAAALTWVALTHAGAAVVSIAHAPSNERSAAVPRRLGYVRQECASAYACSDAGTDVAPVDWHATAAILRQEPLMSFPLPRVFGADGREIEWPST